MTTDPGVTGGLRIDRLRISNFLAFDAATVPAEGRPPFGTINLFVGPNGAGKSSLLNALKHLAHRVAENSGMTISADRDANDASGNPQAGRARAMDFCLEHHDPDREWRIEADVRLGVDETAPCGTVSMECGHPMHRNQPPWTFRHADGRAEPLEHASPMHGVALRVRDGVFPMGWPRRLFNHDQKAFEGSPDYTAQIIEGEKAWSRFYPAVSRLVAAGSWKPADLASPYKCKCGAQEYWSVSNEAGSLARRGIGFALLDDHEVPLLHGSDGAQQATFMLIEIHKHQHPTVFVIEEPDVFLHPGLQIRLMETFQAIADEHHHQFFISTHSPYLIDWAALADPASKSRIFKVRYDEKAGGATIEEPLAENAGSLLDAIGHRPSQVLQPNGVIWVEGPSDAIYIQTWLELWWRERPPERPVRWGLDASIEAYGGTLLKYFTGAGVEGPDLPGEKFRALRDAALRGVIVMDYDLGGTDPKSKWWWDCKQDIVTEFASGDGHWSTWLGHERTRSIECYARRDLVEAAGMSWTKEKGWQAKRRKTKGQAKRRETKVAAATDYRHRVLRESMSFAAAISDDAAIAGDLEQRMREISDAIEAWRTPNA